MGKFGALFEDSDDEGRPAKSVPKPVVPIKIPTPPPPPSPKEEVIEEEEEEEKVPPPPKPATPPPPQNEDSESESLDEPPPRPRPRTPPEDTLSRKHAQDVLALSTAALAQHSTSMSTVQTDMQAGFKQTLGDVQDGFKQSTVSFEKSVEDSSRDLKNELTVKFAEVMTQLKIIGQPPPPPEPIDQSACPPLEDFPEYVVTKVAPGGEGYEEREQYWENQRLRLMDDTESMFLKERERDAQVALEHTQEVTAQLRKEKDELRNSYEEAQMQLTAAETALQTQHNNEAVEAQSFKKSFNDIMKQLEADGNDVKKLLQTEQTHNAGLRKEVFELSNLADERGLRVQQLDLEVGALKVEKHDLEQRIALISVQSNAARSESNELRKMLDRGDKDRTELCARLEEVVKDKYDYMSESAKRHNSHISSLQQKYEEREHYMTSQMTTREAGMRDSMVKFSEHLQKLSEDYLGRQKTTYHKLQIQTNEEHKKALADMREERRLLEEQHRVEIGSLNKAMEETRKTGERHCEEVRKDLNEKLAQLRQEKERALQASLLEAKSRAAEVEKQHRIRETNAEKKAADDKEQLMTMFSRELTKISDEHRKAERDLERHHRERQADLEKHVKYSKLETAADVKRPAAAPAAETGKDEFMDKFDKHRQNLRERHEQAKKSLN